MDEKSIKLYIDLLFSKYLDREPKEDLNTICNYWGYLAKSIDQQKCRIIADIELIQRFESVYLITQDKLSLYPASILDQINKIMIENDLPGKFAIISSYSADELDRISYHSRLPFFSLANSLRIRSFLGISIETGLKSDSILSSKTLFSFCSG